MKASQAGFFDEELRAYTLQQVRSSTNFAPAINGKRANVRDLLNALGPSAVNYPGSTYTLAYEPQSDQLKGVYYQAAIRERFEVAFQRLK